MTLKRPDFGFHRSAIATAIVLCSSYSVAAPVLEEVIVTATIRAESLQDVPVSVNAVSGEKMMEAGIGKVEDLQAYVPNLTMSETGIGTNIYIRGIGSGINPGFEQSVGMYFDGVSYGRAQLSRAPFLDLARVEVLRGPQNILFGKNSIAGALSLISARPSQEFEGMVSGTYEVETNERVLDLVLSGAMTDTIGGRLAIRKRQTDGYMENLTLNRDEPERDEQTIRAIFEWDASANLTAALKLEVGQFDVNGRQIEIINDNPSTDSTFNGETYAGILESYEVGPGGLLGTVSSDPSVLNNRQDYKRSSNGDFSYNDTHNVTLNVDYAWGDHTFTFITGILGYETSELCDCDFTGAEVFSVAAEEEYSQFSQEVRWVSPVGEDFEFIAGAFYQQSSLDFFDSIRVGSDILPTLLNGADVLEGGARGETPLDGDIIGGPLGLPVSGVGDAGTEIINLGTPRNFSSDTKLLSGFIQATWNMSDFTRATLGLRYSYEEKEGKRSLDLTDITTGQSRDIGEVDTVVAKNFSAERHNLSGDRSGGNLAPSLNLQHDWSDEVMLYATASIGYKSGGFDARSNSSPGGGKSRAAAPEIEGSFEYDDEQATSFELGAKTTLLDGAAELNIAAFYTEYDDLQVSIFDGTLGFNVGNAGAATTMGLELDGRMALTENLMMAGALAFLDFEFTEFANGQCYQGQTVDYDVGGNPYCDYKGKTNQYVADYSGNLTFVYTTMVSKDLEFRGGADFVFTGSYNSSQNLDPSQKQDAYIKANLRLSLADVTAGWDAAILVKNLTDETTISYSNDTPLSNSTFGSIGHYGFIDPPRTIALQATYRWY